MSIFNISKKIDICECLKFIYNINSFFVSVAVYCLCNVHYSHHKLHGKYEFLNAFDLVD